MQTTWLGRLRSWIRRLFQLKKKRRSSPRVLARWDRNFTVVLRLERNTAGGIATYRINSLYGESDYLITLDYLPDLHGELVGEFDGTLIRVGYFDYPSNPATHRFAVFRLGHDGSSHPISIWDVDLQGFCQNASLRELAPKRWRIRPLNIVYLEDANADTWHPLPGRLDTWDDVRIVVSDKGEVLLSCEATCEPGLYYTENRLNPNGAFRIKSDEQFQDAWQIGHHKNQLALVQCANLTGFRDDNEDGLRTGDRQFTGNDFGVNQHTTGDSPDAAAPDKIGHWSAGCLVGRYASTHYGKFMPLVKSMNLAKFDTAIVPGDKFAQF